MKDTRPRVSLSRTDPVVPAHHPRVLLETAAEFGADRRRVLEGVGTTEEALTLPETRLSYEQFEVLERNALRLTNNPALGLYFGRNVHIAHIGVLGLAVMSSPNAGAALDVALKYYRWLAPAWELELRIEGDRCIMTACETIPRDSLRVFATEALLAGVYGLAEQILGRKPPVREVRLNYARPAHFAEYARYIDAPIHFGQSVTQVEFDAAILNESIRGSDPATAKLAEEFCAAEASRGAPADDLATQVRRVFAARRGERLALDEVAKALQTSTRTLRRGLQQLGTSFQEILDDTRRARAESYLRFTNMTALQIAEHLGFNDVRSFRRAFKRWTGENPSVFRAQPAKDG